MAKTSKTPRLRDHGIDIMFTRPEDTESTNTPSAVARPGPGGANPEEPSRWDATHHRRTFHCPDALWTRLETWCARSGMSRSATLTQALEAFLASRE